MSNKRNFTDTKIFGHFEKTIVIFCSFAIITEYRQ